MIYTELTAKAMKLAYEYHDGQLDKAGLPYIFHVYAVADKCTSEYSTCVGLLHDILEDTNIEYSLIEHEFPAEVVQAVEILTRDHGVAYKDYIKNIITNKMATEVKLRDLENNMNKQRSALIPGGKKDSLVERYEWAYEYLTNAIKQDKVADTTKTKTANKKSASRETKNKTVRIREQDNYLVYGSALRYGLDIRNASDYTMNAVRTYFYTNIETFSSTELITLSRDVARITDKDSQVNKNFRDDVILTTIAKNIAEKQKSDKDADVYSEILNRTTDIIYDIGRYVVPAWTNDYIQGAIDYFFARLKEILLTMSYDNKNYTYRKNRETTLTNSDIDAVYVHTKQEVEAKHKSITAGNSTKYDMEKTVNIEATKQTWNKIIMAAFYYSIGRRTYIVGVVSDFITVNYSWLYKKNIEKIIETIGEVSKNPERLGDSCDRAGWMNLSKYLKTVIK